MSIIQKLSEMEYATDSEDEQIYYKLIKTLFKCAENYERVLYLNILYINGKLKMTPYMWGPLAFDSKTLQKQLVELNEYGLFTHCGQAGKAGTEYQQFNKERNYYYDSEQKPFLSFLLQKEILTTDPEDIRKTQLFFKKLLEIPNIKLVVVDQENEELIIFPNKINKRGHNKSPVAEKKINVTRTRTYTALEDRKIAHWSEDTNVWIEPNCEDCFIHFFKINGEDFYSCNIVYDEYGSEVILEDLILSVIKSLGWEKILTFSENMN